MSTPCSRSHTAASPRQDGLTALMEMIANMSVAEIDDVLAKRRSPSETATTSDVDLAFSFFAAEAEGLLNLAKDHHTDGVVNEGLADEMLEREETAHYDHLMAIALSEGRDPPPRPPQIHRRNRASSQPQHTHASSSGQHHTVPMPEADIPRGRSPRRAGPSSNAFTRPLTAVRSLRGSRASSPDESSVEDSASRPASPTDSCLSDPTPEPDPLPSCVVCGDEIEGATIDAPCGHHLDVACLRRMFKNSTRDESLFPPKCCQEQIEFEQVNQHLDRPLRELYERKSREFTTKDRVYCHISSCSAFLGSASKGPPTSLACTSRSCRALTCGSCKYAAHPGKACADQLDDIVLELGQKQGWQRCPSCHHLVERNGGCLHMMCRCSGEFCYGCAKPWKACGSSCPR
ncbi:hypothetical protein LXA43DRAFT_260857 [Ganoderma leucocontextum]|nr:hypothetical protein LXA43DRAFT_260857 [Ganoderma leucocontextum]